jgi:4-amino-4-deoxy-L-arabinose transferase-like glycosyltransferase
LKNIHFVEKKGAFALGLGLLWATAALLVNPLGDFPLNDDFSFGRSVYNLTELGVLQFDDWLSMTLITQVFWGGAFCKTFGFSFTVLRFSTLVIGGIGVLAFYFSIRQLARTKWLAFFSALVFAFNPLFFSLSYTFMSDVPFVSLISVALLFYLKFFKTEQLRWLVLASILAIAAMFVRQLGMLLPMAFAITWLFKKKWDLRQLIIGLSPLAVSIFLYAIYMQWFEVTQGIPETFGTFPKLFKRLGDDNFWGVCSYRIGLLALYAGLFLLPFNLIIFKKPKNLRMICHSIGWCAIGTWLMWQGAEKFPYGNILYNFGLGPKTLKDGYFFINVQPVLPQEAVRAIALIGLLGGNLLIVNLVNKISVIKKEESIVQLSSLFAGVCIVIYSGFLMLDVHFFDRYFIPLFLFAMLLLFPNGHSKKVNSGLRGLGFGLLMFTAIFSISATHDHLSWNRARWQALDHLMATMKIPPNQIDGGFEFNGWYRPVKEINQGAFESWWWVDEENYLVAFGDMGGFDKVEGVPFRTYLPPSVDSVYILKKKGSLTNPVEQKKQEEREVEK